MATLLAFPVLAGLMIFQSAIFSQVPLLNGTADLILLAVAAWSIQKRVRTAWQWGIIGGLMMGYVSAVPYYATLPGYLAVVALAVLLRQRVWQAPILAMFIITFLGTIFTHFTTLVVLRILQVNVPLDQAINLITLPSILLNLLLAVPFYALMTDLANWLYPSELEM